MKNNCVKCELNVMKNTWREFSELVYQRRYPEARKSAIKLINSGDKEFVDSFVKSLLFSEYLEALEFLIEESVVSPDYTDLHMNSLLLISVQSKMEKAAMILLNHGASVSGMEEKLFRKPSEWARSAKLSASLVAALEERENAL